jgi:hypothetical protein
MPELTEEEKKILEKLRHDANVRKRDGEKFDPTSDPKKWEAPIGLDDEGNPYPTPPDKK